MAAERLIESSYLARYLLLNAVDISDYAVFPSRAIENAPPVFHFAHAEAPDPRPPLLAQALPGAAGKRPETVDQFLERNGTVAFLAIQHDRLICERYYRGFEHGSICTSFSMAKSFVSALVGIALHERLIGALDDPLRKYLPELAAGCWSQVTLRHLVSMSSGLKYNERGFLPWDDEPRTYYSLDLRALALRAQPAEAPGARFLYNNYNLLLLGLVLERATGGSVSAYLQEKLWKPLGMEFPASWSLDSRHSGMEKMESGLNARAIDFAKFGRLYLRRGDWDGRQIVPESWVAESTTAAPGAPWTNYKYLWWIPRSGSGRFLAVGNLGQFMYVAPDKDCLLLRFGRGQPRDWRLAYARLFATLVESL
jgi:CubicO group peptidase (beta-lactamase class C family)